MPDSLQEDYRTSTFKCGEILNAAQVPELLNSPIIEAVCEFRLLPETQWDLTVPGSIFPLVKHFLPNKEQRVQQAVEVKKTKAAIEQEIHVDERILFLSDDKKMFTQVGAHLLAFNCLKPYPGWESFKARLRQAYEALLDTVQVTN